MKKPILKEENKFPYPKEWIPEKDLERITKEVCYLPEDENKRENELLMQFNFYLMEKCGFTLNTYFQFTEAYEANSKSEDKLFESWKTNALTCSNPTFFYKSKK